MSNAMNPERRRSSTVAAVVVSVLAAIALAACSRTGDRQAGGSPSASTSAPAGGLAPSSAGTSSVPATAASVPEVGSGYRSVIVDETVDNPALDGFERKMTGRMEQLGLPGVSLLVVQHGELVEQEAWMDYDLDTVVQIASSSKWLTAATIMTLVDAGKIDLDAPISSYLDYAEGPFGTITMRQLLSLSSGIKDDESIPCYHDTEMTLDECNRQIAELPLDTSPGVAFHYGGQHMHVAASVAEAVTGKPWTVIFQEQVATPLGMSRTRFRSANGDHHPLPAASAETSLGDYGRFLEMMVHEGLAPSGTRILKPDTVEEMLTSQIDEVKRYHGPPYRNEEHTPYALGAWLDWTDPNGTAIVISSDGAGGFRPWIDRQNDLYGVYMIRDEGSGQVEGDPTARPGAANVPTSGPWVFDDVAQALGGSLPADKTPGI